MLGKFRPRHYLLSTTLLGSVACITPAYAQDATGGRHPPCPVGSGRVARPFFRCGGQGFGAGRKFCQGFHDMGRHLGHACAKLV